MELRLLAADDVKRALPMAAAIEGMKAAFAQFSAGRAVVPLRSRVAVVPGNYSRREASMNSTKKWPWRFWQLLFVLAIVLVACRDEGTAVVAETAVPTISNATATALNPGQSATATPANQDERDFIVVAIDGPNPPFTDFDKFGNVVGINSDIMTRLAAAANLEYEFVVTPYEGVLRSIVANKDFDAVMTAPATIPAPPLEDIAYTDPYLEIGQLLVVLADEEEIQSTANLAPGMPIGIEANSGGEEVARQQLSLDEDDLYEYANTASAMQDLVNEDLRAVIVDNFSAQHFTSLYPEQLKIAGDSEQAWISRKAYGIALSAAHTSLRQRLNEAIAEVRADPAFNQLVSSQFIPVQSIESGESRVGTPTNELVIGMVGQLPDMDPASGGDLIGWEVKSNTMSGLYRINSTSEIVPALAVGPPEISEDKLEYTFTLRTGLQFPNGAPFTAGDVKRSIDRSAGLGNFLVNAYLKDENQDGFIDDDAVQVLGPEQVKLVLQQPTASFLSLLATPPYFPIAECFATTGDPVTCGGIGPYQITNWIQGERMRLQANPQWPLSPPTFENIRLRFYSDADSIRRSFEEFQSVDLVWTGLPYGDFTELREEDGDGDGRPDFIAWEGPAIFKSYVVFEQSTEPWDSAKIRQAFAHAIDRQALADLFGDGRSPLYSPVPDSVPGHVGTFPERALSQARALLLEEGYNQTKPLAITLWYVNDGRYSPLEQQYAEAIKTQLEETGVFEVTLSGAPWEIYQVEINQCGYPAYLLGWPAPPTPGSPVNYLDPVSWTEFFVQETDSVFCSNYESAEMEALFAAAAEELDPGERLALYRDIQELWAEELPTLDLTQELRYALSLPKVDNVRIDALGLLHYDELRKEEE